MLPELLAGIISVAILYHLLRRRFGILSGMLAALALAITPIVVATDRNNTIDSTLCLTLLLAAWSFIKATETGKLRFLLLGVTLVGIGFNIKMLQAAYGYVMQSGQITTEGRGTDLLKDPSVKDAYLGESLK